MKSTEIENCTICGDEYKVQVIITGDIKFKNIIFDSMCMRCGLLPQEGKDSIKKNKERKDKINNIIDRK